MAGFSFAAFAAALAPAVAADVANPGAEVPAVVESTTQDLAAKPVTVTLSYQGQSSDYTTEAKTVGELLAERGLKAGSDDYLSVPESTPLSDGMHLEYRPAVRVTVVLGKRRISLHSSAASISEALGDARIGIAPGDAVLPDRRSALRANEIVRITMVDVWTVHTQRSIAHTTIHRFDAKLATGKTRIVARGIDGIREITTRYTRRGDSPIHKKRISSRIIRRPRPTIVASGTMADDASVPGAGFAGAELTKAMHLARNIVHVIATAYIAGCYKCSGITANGMHAGFGIIAVDPHLIPLGSKLMIPGYGRAIAGDTGGAIVGHRVDLGMNHLADALKFGRRPMTIYVLK